MQVRILLFLFKRQSVPDGCVASSKKRAHVPHMYAPVFFLLTHYPLNILTFESELFAQKRIKDCDRIESILMQFKNTLDKQRNKLFSRRKKLLIIANF